MKSLIVYCLIPFFSVNVFAAAKFELPSAKLEELRKALKDSATANGVKVKNLDKSINCMVAQISEVALNEKNLEIATKDLDWSVRFYQDKLSDAEIAEDSEVMRDNLELVFAPKCLKN